MKRSVIGTDDCFGCGVCAAVCNHDAITIGLNKDGFYKPQIKNAQACTNCGICKKVCSFAYNDVIGEAPLKSFGAWSNNEDIRRLCSSGGLAFEISKLLISHGYKICGVRYNLESDRAEHYIANSLQEALESCGSKYIQSFTLDAFKQIDLREKYLVIGTPCQIDSFRRYIRLFKREENFVLMDFFCHSVPSMNAWKFYLNNVKNQIGKIKSVAWRNKAEGWHNSWAMTFNYEASHLKQNKPEKNTNKSPFISYRKDGDMFYRLFLNDYCSGEACAKSCRFKYDKSAADIRIGDFWGKTYESDNKGVSSLVAFSAKGYDIIQQLNGCSLQEYPFATVAESQMKKNITHALVRPAMMKVLSADKPNPTAVKILIFMERAMRRIKSMLQR